MPKNAFAAAVGVVGGFISNILGGWDLYLQTLVIFMAVDYCTGIMLAAVFKNSTKTETGTLESKAGFKGLCKKGLMLAVVLVANNIDAISGMSLTRDMVIIGFICNETISILENAGLMGIPVPKKLLNIIDVLKSNEEGDE